MVLLLKHVSPNGVESSGVDDDDDDDDDEADDDDDDDKSRVVDFGGADVSADFIPVEKSVNIICGNRMAVLLVIFKEPNLSINSLIFWLSFGINL